MWPINLTTFFLYPKQRLKWVSQICQIWRFQILVNHVAMWVALACLCLNPRPRSQQTDSPPMTIQAFSPTIIEIFSRYDFASLEMISALAWSYVTQNVTKQVSLIRRSESLISWTLTFLSIGYRQSLNRIIILVRRNINGQNLTIWFFCDRYVLLRSTKYCYLIDLIFNTNDKHIYVQFQDWVNHVGGSCYVSFINFWIGWVSTDEPFKFQAILSQYPIKAAMSGNLFVVLVKWIGHSTLLSLFQQRGRK